MRYFFNDAGRCISAITNNPMGNTVGVTIPGEVTEAIYSREGNVSDATATPYLDRSLILRDGLIVDYIINHPAKNTIGITMSCNYWPLSGIQLNVSYSIPRTSYMLIPYGPVSGSWSNIFTQNVNGFIYNTGHNVPQAGWASYTFTITQPGYIQGLHVPAQWAVGPQCDCDCDSCYTSCNGCNGC